MNEREKKVHALWMPDLVSFRRSSHWNLVDVTRTNHNASITQLSHFRHVAKYSQTPLQLWVRVLVVHQHCSYSFIYALGKITFIYLMLSLARPLFHSFILFLTIFFFIFHASGDKRQWILYHMHYMYMERKILTISK